MEEKYMVSDILENTKSCIKDYENAILECSNQELRQTVQLLRNNQEGFQYEVCKIATSKGYYSPVTKVRQDEIDRIRNEIS